MRLQFDNRYLKKIFETNTDYTEWFGYYNYDVISRDGRKLLCNRAECHGRAITAEDSIELGWYDLETSEWHTIDTSNSFNWPQAAMLQWLPGEGNENKVIYNVARDNHFKAIIKDITTNKKIVIDFPTYCVTPDGKYSITLNYERSYWCRAYHYQPIQNPMYDVDIAEDDGVFRVDLQTNNVERIVKIQDVIALDPMEHFGFAKHWLEHIMLNATGTQMVFLHRFTYGDGYVTRICTCNIDGTDLQICSGWRNNTWSHIGWRSENSFAVYSVKRNMLGATYAMQTQNNAKKRSLKTCLYGMARKLIPQSLRRKASGLKQFYQLFEKKDGRYVCVDQYDDKSFAIDGHPSFTFDGSYMITDTYPDANGFQHLYIMNEKSKKVLCVANIFATLQGTPASCDLHPKLSYNNKFLVIDTAYTGKHRMIVFELLWNSIKKSI